jgi:uncharacterized membrane protein YtjA (UPF0391 family)
MFAIGIVEPLQSLSDPSNEVLFVREMFKWVLIGTLIIFSITTILSFTGLATSLGEDEDILFFLRVVSLFASIMTTVGLIVMQEPPNAD